MKFSKKCNIKNGPTSFHMHDIKVIKRDLNIQKGDIFLDVGCGIGDYSIMASNILKDSGLVYSIDNNEKTLADFSENIKKLNIKNIKIKKQDISQKLDFNNNSIDNCLIATVLHAITDEKIIINFFKEINRIIKKSGSITIIECKKEKTEFGPPIHMRICPDYLENILKKQNFKKLIYTDLGNNYLIKFIKI